MSEYESIRNEIISMEEQQRNVWIHMYVLFITLFVLGIELSYHLFLVTYVVLIPFQVVINRYKWSISKMSTYIRLFYEKDEKNLNWESMHISHGYKDYYKKIDNDILGMIRKTGMIQLGFLTTMFFIIFLLKDNYIGNTINLSFMDVIFLLISVCLFFLTIILNREYNKNYDKELTKVINDYRMNLEIKELENKQ